MDTCDSPEVGLTSSALLRVVCSLENPHDGAAQQLRRELVDLLCAAEGDCARAAAIAEPLVHLCSMQLASAQESWDGELIYACVLANWLCDVGAAEPKLLPYFAHDASARQAAFMAAVNFLRERDPSLSSAVALEQVELHGLTGSLTENDLGWLEACRYNNDDLWIHSIILEALVRLLKERSENEEELPSNEILTSLKECANPALDLSTENDLEDIDFGLPVDSAPGIRDPEQTFDVPGLLFDENELPELAPREPESTESMQAPEAPSNLSGSEGLYLALEYNSEAVERELQQQRLEDEAEQRRRRARRYDYGL